MALTKGTIITTFLFFFLSFVLCVAAVSTPLWLDRESFSLHTKLGLTKQCWPSFSGDEFCEYSSSESLPTAWRAVLVFIILGVMSLAVGLICTLMSVYKPKMIHYAKLTGFFSAILFAIATLIFPSGFDSELVSGKPFKLPDNVSIGQSYIMFILATLLVFLGELFASQIIIPGPLFSSF